MSWNVNILTLFPEMFPGPLAYSLAGKGLKNKIWNLKTIQIRDFASDRRKTVDDTCYGHGAGMILKPDVIHAALLNTVSDFKGTPTIVYTTPRGKPFNQNLAQDLIRKDGVIILCGRYEGIDERVIEYWKDEHQLQEISIGDYIISGGEIAALTILDACIRLLPNIVHSEESLIYESFELDLLEFPQYTKPYNWQDRVVPDVLLSGDHKRIALWQQEQAEKITQERRPDLWEAYLKKNSHT